MGDVAIPRNPNEWTFRWFVGMLIASTFSLVYIVAPIYIMSAVLSFLILPLKQALFFSFPILLSAAIPAMDGPWLVGMLTPMLDYFQYEEHYEQTNEELREMLQGSDRRFLLAFQPHGVISFCGMCAAVHAPPDLRHLKTAVASSVLQTPLLKHVMGIFCLMDASKASLQKHFRKPGYDGSVALYVGGIAELFKSSPTEERLFLSKRKGFIKLALREGVDVTPAYLFGNTSVLTVLKSGPLASLSRGMGVALTYFWGKWYLPIPRDDKLLYVRAKPMGLPHIPQPTNDDVDKWHAKYCQEIIRLFDTHKEKVPLYKHKKLYID